MCVYIYIYVQCIFPTTTCHNEISTFDVTPIHADCIDRESSGYWKKQQIHWLCGGTNLILHFIYTWSGIWSSWRRVALKSVKLLSSPKLTRTVSPLSVADLWELDSIWSYRVQTCPFRAWILTLRLLGFGVVWWISCILTETSPRSTLECQNTLAGITKQKSKKSQKSHSWFGPGSCIHCGHFCFDKSCESEFWEVYPIRNKSWIYGTSKRNWFSVCWKKVPMVGFRTKQICIKTYVILFNLWTDLCFVGP